jgi:hypothetical protein
MINNRLTNASTTEHTGKPVRPLDMSSQNSLDEVVAMLRRLADLQLEYAKICEQKAQELYLNKLR